MMASCLCAGPPDPPYNVQLRHCGSWLAEVSWSPGSDNNQPVNHYIVYYNTSFDEPDLFTVGARVSASRDSANVRLDSSWTNYTFSVKAHNSLGLSERSAFTAMCPTPERIPRKNPSDVCSVSRGADQLVVTWEVLLLLLLLLVNVKINVALSENASRTRYIIKIKSKLRK